MGTQPVVSKDQVRVAVHIELHERRLLVEAAEYQLRGHGTAGGALRTVRLPHGGGMPRRRGAAARRRKLRRELRAQEAVLCAGVE